MAPRKNKLLFLITADLDVQQKKQFLITAAFLDLALARLLLQRFRREP